MARHSVPGIPRRTRPGIPQLEEFYQATFGETMYPAGDMRIGGKSFDRAALRPGAGAVPRGRHSHQGRRMTDGDFRPSAVQRARQVRGRAGQFRDVQPARMAPMYNVRPAPQLGAPSLQAQLGRYEALVQSELAAGHPRQRALAELPGEDRAAHRASQRRAGARCRPVRPQHG
jgi:hypothetical protein